MLSFIFKSIAGILLLFLLGGFLRTWQMEKSDNQKLFLSGTVPSPVLNGFYDGSVSGHKFSWVGKSFDSLNNSGINVFQNGDNTQVNKYTFTTSTGKGITDKNLDVLKIDYNVVDNPIWLKFVLDEVVQTGEGQYLGKLQVRFIWGHPFTLGFFTLKTPPNNYEQDGNKDFKVGTDTFHSFWSSDLGVTFSYRISPNGYEFIEKDVAKVSDKTLEKYFEIINKKDYEELLQSTTPREGPPNITLMIFKNPDGKHANDWLKDHASVVNYKLSTALLGLSLGGTQGVRYSASGLYKNDVVVLENNYRIYVFTGAYNADTDTIRKDFLDFIKTINLF